MTVGKMNVQEVNQVETLRALQLSDQGACSPGVTDPVAAADRRAVNFSAADSLAACQARSLPRDDCYLVTCFNQALGQCLAIDCQPGTTVRDEIQIDQTDSHVTISSMMALS
jgi:hypothetical protein